LPKHTLNKSDRLKSYTKIRALFNAGEKLKQFPLTVFYLFGEEKAEEKKEGSLQMGVAVGSRNFKKAVDRNLLKRRIREAYRLQKNELRAVLLESQTVLEVFFVYGDNQIADYATISNAMKKILEKLQDIHAKKINQQDGNG
jgi:ribonuclease P protein component